MAKRRGSGEGTVRERDGGTRWEARYHDINGTRRSVYGATQADCLRHLRDALALRDQGRGAAVRMATTLATHLDDVLAVSAITTRPTTQETYAYIAGLITREIGATKLHRVSTRQIDRLYATLAGRPQALSPATIRLAHILLVKAFDQAIVWSLVTVNPARAATPPSRSPREPLHLTAAQARVLLESASRNQPDRWTALWFVLLTTGIRVGEAFALRWTDVDLDAGRTLTVRATSTKTKAGGIARSVPKTTSSLRTVAFPRETADVLRAHRQRQRLARINAAVWVENTLVFPAVTGRQQASNAARAPLHRALARENLPIMSPHALRHTYATLLLAHTNPRVAQVALGHSAIATTAELYSHVSADLLADAARTIGSALFGPEGVGTGVKNGANTGETAR